MDPIAQPHESLPAADPAAPVTLPGSRPLPSPHILHLAWKSNAPGAPAVDFAISLASHLFDACREVAAESRAGEIVDDLDLGELAQAIRNAEIKTVRFRTGRAELADEWQLDLTPNDADTGASCRLAVTVCPNEQPWTQVQWWQASFDYPSPVPLLAVPYSAAGVSMAVFHGLVVLAARLAQLDHTRIVRWHREEPVSDTETPRYLEHRLYDRLKRFDQGQRDEADRVFAWGDDSARTQQWVGVIQVPGLQIEILPKIDAATPDETAAGQHEARRNLLYMLAVAGDVPVRSRDVARLSSRRAPLSETLAAIFADRLLRELLRGPERAYLQQEENLRRFQGKLLIAQQTLRNAAHRERFFCRFDEFCDDAPMNRIFRAACRVLLDTMRTPSTQDLLRHCLLVLDQVEDVVIHDALFDRVVLTRQTERFADVFRFCKLILQGRSPTVRAGAERSFSLLFDMNQVFERFVAAFLRSRVLPRLDGYQLFPQARRRQRHLMTRDGRGVLPLRPDLLIEAPDGRRLVMDTKWKRLSENGGRGGVSTGDLYQLYAYTRRYGCVHSMLLYPHAPGLIPRTFDILDHADAWSGERVGVRFVNLHRDLHLESERCQLADELTRLVLDGFQWNDPAPSLVVVGGAV